MNGENMFKTFPGGLISLIFDLIYWSFFIIYLNQMVNKTTWKLTTQNVLNSSEELMYGVTNDNLGNFTLSI